MFQAIFFLNLTSFYYYRYEFDLTMCITLIYITKSACGHDAVSFISN